ncbi:hypothetical protein [Wolbachia endosymbiont of Pentidionis agamae]|uniref:hypothetical protein n=1 Tax=Wolbachia endosymbiont of Pentidionis agamae TaxID=3110435 RepID=UPI002FD17BBE
MDGSVSKIVFERSKLKKWISINPKNQTDPMNRKPIKKIISIKEKIGGKLLALFEAKAYEETKNILTGLLCKEEQNRKIVNELSKAVKLLNNNQYYKKACNLLLKHGDVIAKIVDVKVDVKTVCCNILERTNESGRKNFLEAIINKCAGVYDVRWTTLHCIIKNSNDEIAQQNRNENMKLCCALAVPLCISTIFFTGLGFSISIELGIYSIVTLLVAACLCGLAFALAIDESNLYEISAIGITCSVLDQKELKL